MQSHATRGRRAQAAVPPGARVGHSGVPRGPLQPNSSTLRRGACPSVWQPMARPDGMLIRLPVRQRGLSAPVAWRLGELADAFGDGTLQLTRRGGLQLRGIARERVRKLRQALMDLGLASADAERARTESMVLNSPLEGLGAPSKPLKNARRAILRALHPAVASGCVSPKFAVVVESPIRLFSRVDADLRVLAGAGQGETFLQAGQTCVRPAPRDLQRTVSAWVSELMSMAPGARLRDAHQLHGAAAVHGRLLGRASPVEGCAPFDVPCPNHAPVCVGARADLAGFVVAAPLALTSTAAWRELASLAQRIGEGRLRVLPEGRVLLGANEAESQLLRHEASRLGWLTNPRDPRLGLSACTGAPHCESAHGPTRHWMSSLTAAAMPLLARGTRLHVSGCAKRCALVAEPGVVLTHHPGGLVELQDTRGVLPEAPELVPIDAVAARLRALAKRVPEGGGT